MLEMSEQNVKKKITQKMKKIVENVNIVMWNDKEKTNTSDEND